MNKWIAALAMAALATSCSDDDDGAVKQVKKAAEPAPEIGDSCTQEESFNTSCKGNTLIGCDGTEWIELLDGRRLN